MKGLIGVALAVSGMSCGGNDTDDTTNKQEVYINAENLDTLDLTFCKGRTVGRAVINAKDASAETALLALGISVVDLIPLDGSAPANDAELIALIPAPPLSGDLSVWSEELSDQINGPWLVSTDAFDWIDGGAAPFENNGFEAVAGDTYQHDSEPWTVGLEVVNMGTPTGADAAFRAAQWDRGTKQ